MRKNRLSQDSESKGQRGKEWWDSTQALPRYQNKGLFPAKTICFCQILLLELHDGNE